MKVLGRDSGLFIAFEAVEEIGELAKALSANYENVKNSEDTKFPVIFAMLNNTTAPDAIDAIMDSVYDEYYSIKNMEGKEDVESCTNTEGSEEGPEG